MDDKTYRRMFCETPRQVRIRHNWPALNHLRTKAERQDHELAVAEFKRGKHVVEGNAVE
jgi:hypothetical protein